MPFDFALNPSLDLDLLKRVYAEKKRLHIPDFLSLESAQNLHSHLCARTDWLLLFNANDKIYELNSQAEKQLSAKQRDLLYAAIFATAATSFQYHYRTIRVPDDMVVRSQSSDMLSCFAQFLASEAVLAIFRAITGQTDFNFVDAQATAYRAGDFLTSHNDNVSGKNRSAAYVINLTPKWRAEIGGLLMFHGHDGHIDEAFVPCFNALNIFSVPMLHSVSQVTPSALAPRYSITGWLRHV